MNNKLQLFSKEPGFLKLFTLFKEKYRSLGRIGGTVSLEIFQPVEIESIAGFLGQSEEKILQKGSIALLDFEKELANTGFSQYTLFELLEIVLGESIYTKKEELERAQQQEDLFIKDLRRAMSTGAWWFDWLAAKTADTRWIWSLYKQNKDELYEQLLAVSQAFSELPTQGTFERMPLFAQRMTGNPHYFDNNEVAGKLLLHWLYVDQIMCGNQDAVMPRMTEEVNDLLAEYGIMRDDLWNFVTCQGLLAANQDGVHPVWQAAIQTETVLNVPMKELLNVEKIWPNDGTSVWVVENSSVASTMMDALPTAPIICTHGQLRMASWRLLDLLVQANCILFYSGDLDPEGVAIAERLKKRYHNQVVFWRMDRAAYEASVSNEDISKRLSKVEQIASPEWSELICLMRDVKMAGYQEALVEQLIDDIVFCKKKR